MDFEIETLTKAKLLDVVVLSQKNRQPDENPGAKLTVELALANHSLAMFDGFLKGMLFSKKPGAATKDAQGTLDGVEVVSDMPHLSGIGAKVGSLHWTQDGTGYALTIDLGLGGSRSNLEMSDCTLSGWTITPKEGGTVEVKVNIESADVSETSFGKLAKLKSREIQILLTPPAVQQDDIDGGDANPPPSKRRKGKALADAVH